MIHLGIVIQARLGSTRLSNKVLLDFNNGCSILELMLENILKETNRQYQIVLATSTAQENVRLRTVAQRFSVSFFQGDEQNVLSRFLDIGHKNAFTHMVRVCADNPFLNTAHLSLLIRELQRVDIDYISYHLADQTPIIKSHHGLFCEIVSLKALEKVSRNTVQPRYLENVTEFVYTFADRFNTKIGRAPDSVYNRKDLRFTVDDKVDFDNVREIYQALGSQVQELDKLIDFVDKHPEISESMITQIKKYTK